MKMLIDPSLHKSELDNRMLNSRRQDGLSLLELVITLGLILVLSSSLTMALLSTQGLSRDIFANTQGLGEVERVIERVADRLNSGTQLIAVSETSLLFQDLTDPMGDGTFADDDGNLIWGASGNEGWAYEYVWITVGNFDESLQGLDLNSDGDLTDVFAQGDLSFRVLNEFGAVQQNIALTGGGKIFRDDGDQLPALFTLINNSTIEIQLSMPIIEVQKGQSYSQLFQATKRIVFR